MFCNLGFALGLSPARETVEFVKVEKGDPSLKIEEIIVSLFVGGGYPQVLFFFCAPYSCGRLIFSRCNVFLPKHKRDDFVLSEAGFDSSDLQVSRIRIQAIFKRN